MTYNNKSSFDPVKLSKYKKIAKKYNIKNIIPIKPGNIYFDERARLKCRWGCDSSKRITIRCDDKGFSVSQAEKIIKNYKNAFLLHSDNVYNLTHACLEIEKELFLDGKYFALTLRACNYCNDCDAKKGLECKNPEKIRPCEEMMGIDVFKTVRNLNLPIEVLKSEDDPQNRYGFVLID